MGNNVLPSWRNTPVKRTIIEFVRSTADQNGRHFVAPEDRIAVFDNDGTLWCEKPLPVQADFLLARIGVMAREDPSLRSRQPWKAVSEKDYGWLSNVITKHYNGDDSDLKEMAGGLMQAYAGVTVEEFESAANSFFETARHPTNGRPYSECTYAPMIELLRFLEQYGFTNYIASGGGRDFMRLITQDIYGVPPERVIGSSVVLAYDATRRTIVHKAAPDVFDEGPEKPVRIWNRTGRRPVLACGNSNGDVEMLEFASHSRPSLSLLIAHDDAAQEFSYTTGAEKALERAAREGWPIVSMKDAWETVFGRRLNKAA
jgi:phosphoserine phosphatase